MSYFRELFDSSFRNAWELVFAQSIPSVLLGGAIFVSTLAVLRYRKRHEEVKTRIRDLALAGAITISFFCAAFLLYALILTPKQLVDTARRRFSDEHAARLNAEQELQKTKDDLAAVPPSEQGAEIARLRKAVRKFEDKEADDATREWPALTNDQIEEWVKALRSYRINEFWVYRVDIIGSQKLYQSLRTVGSRLGFRVEVGYTWYVAESEGGTPRPGDIFIDTKANNPVGPVVFELLRKNGCSAKLTTEQIANEGNVCFAIGERK